MKNIYLDHASTTPTDPEVVSAMQPYWNEQFGNPSSLYRLGQVAKNAVDGARQTVANILNATNDEIIFTGGGTMSINLAIKGVMEAYGKNPGHFITTTIEHHAVLHSADTLKRQGHEVSILPVDEYGQINLKDLESAIQDNTVLISIMMANNEIGTIQDIQKIGAKIEKINKARAKQNLNQIYFHTDACQAAGTLDLDVKKLHVDLLTLNGSKIYGPKGIGVLYIKRGTKIRPLIDGGGQEKNLNSGTENVPAIVGLAKALEMANKNKIKENKRQTALRDWAIKEILKIPKTRLNGHAKNRLPNNINISILDIEGEAMLLYLDEVGIQASTGSACTSTTLDPSHVIRALGCPYEAAHGSMRFTLGKNTTKKDLEYLVKQLKPIVEHLRKASPVRVDMNEVEKAVKDASRKVKKL